MYSDTCLDFCILTLARQCQPVDSPCAVYQCQGSEALTEVCRQRAVMTGVEQRRGPGYGAGPCHLTAVGSSRRAEMTRPAAQAAVPLGPAGRCSAAWPAGAPETCLWEEGRARGGDLSRHKGTRFALSWRNGVRAVLHLPPVPATCAPARCGWKWALEVGEGKRGPGGKSAESWAARTAGLGLTLWLVPCPRAAEAPCTADVGEELLLKHGWDKTKTVARNFLWGLKYHVRSFTTWKAVPPLQEIGAHAWKPSSDNKLFSSFLDITTTNEQHCQRPSEVSETRPSCVVEKQIWSLWKTASSEAGFGSRDELRWHRRCRGGRCRLRPGGGAALSEGSPFTVRTYFSLGFCLIDDFVVILTCSIFHVKVSSSKTSTWVGVKTVLGQNASCQRYCCG